MFTKIDSTRRINATWGYSSSGAKVKKTIDAYSRAVCWIPEHFDCCPDKLTPKDIRGRSHLIRGRVFLISASRGRPGARLKNALSRTPDEKSGLTSAQIGRYGFAVFTADSSLYNMLGLQTGRAQFERWRCGRPRKASSYPFP